MDLRTGPDATRDGAPNDKGAGIDIFKNVGDRVEAGEALFRIRACLPADFRFATAAGEDDAFTLEAPQ
jgi:thymidine phosphorylase